MNTTTRLLELKADLAKWEGFRKVRTGARRKAADTEVQVLKGKIARVQATLAN